MNPTRVKPSIFITYSTLRQLIFALFGIAVTAVESVIKYMKQKVRQGEWIQTKQGHESRFLVTRDTLWFLSNLTGMV